MATPRLRITSALHLSVYFPNICMLTAYTMDASTEQHLLSLVLEEPLFQLGTKASEEQGQDSSAEYIIADLC